MGARVRQTSCTPFIRRSPRERICTGVLSLTFALAFCIEAPAQSDLELLTRVIPPNVMILLDNSGSMSHAMWPDDFDPEVFYDTGAVRAD